MVVGGVRTLEMLGGLCCTLFFEISGSDGKEFKGLERSNSTITATW